ncbi:ArnT family glycosyltransferase [Carboxylicivirga sp. RSCT41]|uniref:ArnT family glycosyltransferase n=1 Tax=Carboxylicivirga agarovorans TaxID=3417570 RepID=UPI003D33BE4E
MNKTKSLQASQTILTKVEDWCQKHQLAIISSILGIFTLFSLLLFNLRVSEGGDDSTYIIRAVNFINDGSYPSFQGPLYPMFLSIFVALFGIKLGLLKITSFALMLISMWLFYKTFKDKIAYTLLFATLLMISVSSYFIYFTSQTYSEALFLLLQVPVFTLVYELLNTEKDTNKLKYIIALSAVILASFLTRTIGIGTLIAVILFFIINKQYKNAGLVAGCFIIMLGLFLIIKSAIWQTALFDSGQASTLIYKHPYQLDKGKETIGGFITRFIDNSNLYLSKHFLKMTGWRSLSTNATISLLTILIYALFGFSTVRAFKNNKHLLFVAVYLVTMLGITFIVLQKLWDQYRLIIPFFPFMVLILLYGVLEFSRNKKSKLQQYLFIILVGISVVSTTAQSLSKIDLLTLRKNLKGDVYEGYTDDWRNYLSMAEFAGEELPENTMVAVRKPNMARIYANGKKFYGIYRFDTTDPDQLLQRLKEREVTHVIMASLRKNPLVNNGQTINTIQRYLYIISQKYPTAFKFQKQIGTVEPAYLFLVDYDAAAITKDTTNQETK